MFVRIKDNLIINTDHIIGITARPNSDGWNLVIAGLPETVLSNYEAEYLFGAIELNDAMLPEADAAPEPATLQTRTSQLLRDKLIGASFQQIAALLDSDYAPIDNKELRGAINDLIKEHVVIVLPANTLQAIHGAHPELYYHQSNAPKVIRVNDAEFKPNRILSIEDIPASNPATDDSAPIATPNPAD